MACYSENEFPRKVTEAAIEILIAKKEEERLANMRLLDKKEASDEAHGTSLNKEMAELREENKRLEAKLDKIMDMLRGK